MYQQGLALYFLGHFFFIVLTDIRPSQGSVY